jgi:16S rRNA (adenine1518-N6/adenine1519-N6)-dimethyltransferase
VSQTQEHPKRLLQHAGLVAKRHFGQNFLSDASLCRRIAQHAAPTGTRTVIEIGAGLGALTAALLEQCERVVAIERDRDLVPQLQAVFADSISSGQLTVVEDDAKSFDYAATYAELPKPACLAGNLPYQLTGPLLRRSLDVSTLIERCTFLVQLEVADRLVAAPNDDAYGALTVFLHARYSVCRQFIVRRGAFYPQPNVDSAVVTLTPLAHPITEETPLFRALVKSAFAQRRKKLRNAWSGVGALTAAELAHAALRAEVDLDCRGEVLSVVEFARMAAEVTLVARPEAS